MSSITFEDLYSQETLRDPLKFYGPLREQEPLAAVAFGPMKLWLLSTSYDETVELLKDPRLVKDMRNAFPDMTSSPWEQYGKVMQLFTQNMLAADPPDHTRLRGLVSKAFTPRMIEQLRPRIQEITDELLDSVQDRGQMDLVADFAYPLPITVISEMLGIPVADRPQFRTWTHTLLTCFNGPDFEATMASVGDAFVHYIQNLLADKRAHPGPDLTSALLHVEENGETLSEDERISMIWLLIVAGHETTANLISNGTLVLLQHPDQLHLLQNDPSLIVPAVEELLRYAAPVPMLGNRWAREDIPVHGQIIHKGDMMRISAVSADLDPQHFSDPETLDITREVNRHLAFGRGIHVCLGAPLARLEGQIAFNALLRRLPNLRLDCEPEQLTWNSVPNLRGLTALPVAF